MHVSPETPHLDTLSQLVNLGFGLWLKCQGLALVAMGEAGLAGAFIYGMGQLVGNPFRRFRPLR